jgi:hypothetical protein
MQAAPFLQQPLFAFLVFWVRHTGIYRADLGTLWFAMVANAFRTLIGVDYVAGFSLRDSIVFALSFTCSTTYAIISNFVCHLSLSSIYFVNKASFAILI